MMTPPHPQGRDNELLRTPRLENIKTNMTFLSDFGLEYYSRASYVHVLWSALYRGGLWGISTNPSNVQDHDDVVGLIRGTRASRPVRE